MLVIVLTLCVRYSSAQIVLTLDTPRLEYLSLINTTQKLNLRHTAQLHTLKIVAYDPHYLDFKSLAHLTELKFVVPLAEPQTKFTQLHKLSVSVSQLDAWLACAPNVKEVGLYYGHMLPTNVPFSNVHTIDVHTEDTLQLLPKMSASTFKCTKFHFQSVSRRIPGMQLIQYCRTPMSTNIRAPWNTFGYAAATY